MGTKIQPVPMKLHRWFHTSTTSLSQHRQGPPEDEQRKFYVCWTRLLGLVVEMGFPCYSGLLKKVICFCSILDNIRQAWHKWHEGSIKSFTKNKDPGKALSSSRPRLPLLPHASDKRNEQREMQLLRRSSQLSLWSPNSPPPSRDIRAGNSGRKIRTSHSKMANKYMIKYSAKLAIRDMNIKP